METHQWLFGLFSSFCTGLGYAPADRSQGAARCRPVRTAVRASQVRGATARMTVMVLAACYAVARLRFANGRKCSPFRLQ